MKTNTLKNIFLGLSLISICSFAKAQNGLENIIVERYYVSNAADSAVSVGILPVGSVTYRVYVDMLPGYKFQMAYGSPQHTLSITTTTSFFNNEDRGGTNPTYTKTQAKNNTVMLDSWLSAGAACAGNFGILKTEDDSVATVINSDGVLQNADTSAGIPLSFQDGLIAGTPGIFGTLGIDSVIAVFDATSQAGNSFTITNGGWFCLAGSVGPKEDNKVLIAQLTTNGQLSFKLNIQLGTPDGNIKKYVWDNPVDTSEMQLSCLTYFSPVDTSTIDTTVTPPVNVQNSKINKDLISIYPNPGNGIFFLNTTSESNNDNYSYVIYDITGNVVLTKGIESTSANHTERIDMSSFSNGIYFIEVSLKGVRTTSKLIKN
jgi:hypothetical protein